MSDAADLEFLAFQEALVRRYSLDREVGRGGMGVVYLARDVKLDRPVAIKLLPPAYAAQTVLRERFLREASTAAKLSHPNVVPIHSVEEVDDFVFFVMAYVEGETLGERIRTKGPVTPSEAARILREVSWALAYAHAHGVVHRDVKPDNILLEAGSGRALVTDFGIAQVSEAPGITAVSEVVGTAEFMSPEQAAGDPVDERSDVYALGVVGPYMLSGRLPFEGETVAATRAKQITQVAPSLASVAPEVPKHLSKAIDRCLAKDPDARFEGGEALSEALGRSLEARTEVPVALRVFIEQSRERFRGGWGLLLLVVYLVGLGGFVVYVEGDLIGAVIAATLGAMFGAAPAVLLGRMTRKLLGSGYGHRDLLMALREDLRRQKEQLAFELAGEVHWIDRIAPVLTYGGLALMTLATVALVVLEIPFQGPLLAVTVGSLVLGGLTSLVAAPIAMTRLKSRRKPQGRRWLKFWESRLGRWMFKVAGLGLKRAVAGGVTYRPTEMAIGLAADRLYEELPHDLRAKFRELPAVVARLEADAERTRARVAELDEIIDDVDTQESRASRSIDVAERRDALSGELLETRDAAQERLGQLVGALESIRLELLRWHAGIGSVESMTADLGAARELSDDLARVLEGQRQVAELLGEVDANRELETPLPT